MPGKQVKDWGVYHALRHRGYNKAAAARIANSPRRRRGRIKRGRKRLSRKRGMR